MTKFKSFRLSMYLIGTWLVDLDKQIFKESVISVRVLLWIKWWGKRGS